MKDYWEKLSGAQKAGHVFWIIVGLFVLSFALFNWDTITLNLIFGRAQMPLTVLIFVSMFGGYGYAKLFGYIKSRKKDKEIQYLKGEVSALREKVRKPIPVSKSTATKEIETKNTEEETPEED